MITFGPTDTHENQLSHDHRHIIRLAEHVAFVRDDLRQRVEGLTAIHVPGSLVRVELNSRAHLTDQVHRGIRLHLG